MNAIIVEDEAIAARRLKRLISEIEGTYVDIIDTFESIEDTVSYLLTNDYPDIIFLDIHVADGNSLELFNILDNIKSDIIFTTAYSEYGVQAFRQNALDYLLKPIKKEELIEALNRKSRLSIDIVNKLKEEVSEYKSRFLIRFGAKLHIVKTEEIAYIYSENKISYFVLQSGKKVPSDYKLQDLEKMLDPSRFFRANRQMIIYIDSIAEIITYSKSRVKLKLSPAYHKELVVSTETTPKFKTWLDR